MVRASGGWLENAEKIGIEPTETTEYTEAGSDVTYARKGALFFGKGMVGKGMGKGAGWGGFCVARDLEEAGFFGH